MKGIDCVTRLNAGTAARVKAAGFDFVGRYLVPPGMNKELTRAEAEAISGAGLGLLCVWETYANRALEGEPAGAVDGAKALQCAREIDMPESGIIYFAVDFDASPSQMDSIAGYLRGARAQTGPYNIGVYGSFAVCEAMAARVPEVCRGYWQCVAWSGPCLTPHRTVYQRLWSGAAEAVAAKELLGFPVDINDCEDLAKAGIWQYDEDAALYDDSAPEWLESITPEQAYRLLQKAQEYAAAMPLSWSGISQEDLEAAKSAGITDGRRPLALCTRAEAAVMARRACHGGNNI